jgi:hypothetical protein
MRHPQPNTTPGRLSNRCSPSSGPTGHIELIDESRSARPLGQSQRCIAKGGDDRRVSLFPTRGNGRHRHTFEHDT